MALIFASSYIGAFRLMLGSPRSTTSGIETAYSDAGIEVNGTSSPFQLQTPTFPAPLSEGWSHVYCSMGSTAANKIGYLFGFYNTLRGNYDVGVWITNVSGSDFVEIMYWNGTAMVSAGAAVSMSSFGAFHYDLYFKSHPTEGEVRLYKGESLLYSASGLNTSNVAPDAHRWRGGNTYLANVVMSQMIVADESTIGARVFTPNISAGSVNTFASGGAADLSVDASRQTSTFATADTDGQMATFSCEDLTTSMEVMGVALNTRAKRGSSGPTNMNAVARVGSTNYDSDVAPLVLGVEANNYVFNVNPATGLAWTATQINDAEFGMRFTT